MSTTRRCAVRPCIDLHDGQVKQIVGSSLRTNDESAGEAVENFVADQPAESYAALYQQDQLPGGHVIMLGPGNTAPAKAALAAWPGGLQVGGGITADNCQEWIESGASHVIVTSFCFHDGLIDYKRIQQLVDCIGKDRLVLDLSCRKKDGHYYVVTNKWQSFTCTIVNTEALQRLAQYCSEFLVHAVDVEGKQSGIQQDLVEFLGQHSPIPVTYAGGVRSLEDLDLVERLGQGKVDVTVGSALDIFGGPLSYADVVAWHRQRHPLPHVNDAK